MPVYDFNFHQTSKQERLNKVDKEVSPVAKSGDPRIYMPGRGLDIGTANIVAALQNPDGSVTTRSQRNAFINVEQDEFTENLLSKLKVDYFTHQDQLYVLGDAAFEIANFLDRETRRPMKDGVISPEEIEALPMIEKLIGQIIGEPTQKDEPIYVGIPAKPIDTNMNIIYHRAKCLGFLSKMGYDPESMEEGQAIIFAELARDDYTGIGISCGAGMFNIAVSYKSMSCLAFSTSHAGDWIDKHAAIAMNMKATKMTAIKERGIDLLDPEDKEAEALSVHYRSAIKHTLENISEKFKSDEMPSFNESIDIVCAGGTSMAKGFIDLFVQEYESLDFPISVKNIRLAEDPLDTIARGLLMAVQNKIT